MSGAYRTAMVMKFMSEEEKRERFELELRGAPGDVLDQHLMCIELGWNMDAMKQERGYG